MFKQKYRKKCRDALIKKGYRDPQLFFERSGREYTSYWGDGLRRMEVICFKANKTVHIYELTFCGKMVI